MNLWNFHSSDCHFSLRGSRYSLWPVTYGIPYLGKFTMPSISSPSLSIISTLQTRGAVSIRAGDPDGPWPRQPSQCGTSAVEGCVLHHHRGITAAWGGPCTAMSTPDTRRGNQLTLAVRNLFEEYLKYVFFLNTVMVLVVEILPCGRYYKDMQLHHCWWPDISRGVIWPQSNQAHPVTILMA